VFSICSGLASRFFAYQEKLHMADWLPSSFRTRIIIWEYTTERVLDHPWLGVGADSTRALKEPRTIGTAEQPPGFGMPMTYFCKLGLNSVFWEQF
jgi:O-antigen ligase